MNHLRDNLMLFHNNVTKYPLRYPSHWRYTLYSSCYKQLINVIHQKSANYSSPLVLHFSLLDIMLKAHHYYTWGVWNPSCLWGEWRLTATLSWLSSHPTKYPITAGWTEAYFIQRHLLKETSHVTCAYVWDRTKSLETVRSQACWIHVVNTFR